MAGQGESELIIIGAGPGGYAAAFHAADKGMKVTLVDAGPKPGGACLYVGCIPSKALLHVAKLVTDAREAAKLGLQFEKPHINLDGVRNGANKVVDTMGTNLAGLCKNYKIEYLQSRAAFEDSQTIRLSNGKTRRFGHCIIAVGSEPVIPPPLRLDNPRVMDSTIALRLEEIPASLLVVGGGYIGLELGYVYAALGSRVTVVEMMDGLLPGVDRDLVRPLQARLETMFQKIHLKAKVDKLEATKRGIRATLEGEGITDKEQEFDRVLVAVGRKPCSRNLGLEKTKVHVNERGFIKVDQQLRTTDSKIYAIGDVAGEPMLAHKASHEGKVAVEAILGEPAAFDNLAIPAVVFTDPEIAWCGLTETEARQQKRDIKSLRFPWAASGRAFTLGRTEGLTKVLVEPQSERVVGVGIVGEGAGELIAEGVVAVEMAATARDLALSIHAHPTLSETLGEAAESFYGSPTHIYRPLRKTSERGA
jgi:dihydrolipoamide dehydrogenase